MTTITVSPNGRNFYEHGGPATELLVGTADGVVALNRSGAGEPWQEAHRELRGKHIESLVLEPTRGVIFAGAQPGRGLGQRRRGPFLGAPRRRHRVRQDLCLELRAGRRRAARLCRY